MLKMLPVLLGMLFSAGCFAAVPKVESPASIMQLHKVVKAIDNAVCGKPVKTMILKSSGTLSAMNVRVDMEAFHDIQGGRIMSRMKAQGMPDTVELFDGKNGYTIMLGIQTRTLTGKKLAQVRFAARAADPAKKLFETYENLMLDQKMHRIDGRVCYRLVGTPKGEPELTPREFFYDAKTYLLYRENSTVMTDMGEIPASMTCLQYRKINGMPVPVLMRMTQLNMTIMVRVEKVEFDQPVPEKVFDREAIENEAE